MRRGISGSILLLLLVTAASCSYTFYPADCSRPLPGKLVRHTALDTAVFETSGLLYHGGKIWTFNDSGGEAALYCVDPEDGSVIGRTLISNALNADWEDIAMDSSHIYVADVGNNYGTRDTVCIYRIPRTGVLSGDTAVVQNGRILISFDKKAECNRRGLSSKDCEALLSYGDSLYLFSKDWVNLTTSVYVLPKVPGHYLLSPKNTYHVKALITGADVDEESRTVSLVGYRDFIPVIIRYGFGESPAVIQCGGKAKIYYFLTGSQVEGIVHDDLGRVYVSSEAELLGRPLLFKLK